MPYSFITLRANWLEPCVISAQICTRTSSMLPHLERFPSYGKLGCMKINIHSSAICLRWRSCHPRVRQSKLVYKNINYASNIITSAYGVHIFHCSFYSNPLWISLLLQVKCEPKLFTFARICYIKISVKWNETYHTDEITVRQRRRRRRRLRRRRKWWWWRFSAFSAHFGF